MAKDLIQADLGGEILSADQLAAIPDFSGIRKDLWDKFPGAIARKEYAPGEILMREGDNGTTAFYILSGDVEVYLNAPLARVESSRGGNQGWLRGLSRITNY